MKIGLDVKKKTKNVDSSAKISKSSQKKKLSKLKAFGKDTSNEQKNEENLNIPINENDMNFFEEVSSIVLDDNTTSVLEEGDIESDEAMIEMGFSKELVHNLEPEELFIEPSVLFSLETLEKTDPSGDLEVLIPKSIDEDFSRNNNSDEIPLEVDDQIVLEDFVDEIRSDTTTSTVDIPIKTKTKEEVPSESTLESKNILPYKISCNSTDNFMTDYEFEILMDIFSGLSKVEVDALPENYKKIFYQNFEENEAFLDEETNNIIHKKLGIRSSRALNIPIASETTIQEIINKKIQIDKIILPVELLNKTLSKKNGILIEQKSLENIKDKLKCHVTTENLKKDFIPELKKNESSLVVYYVDANVPEAELIQEGIIGLKPYKVFIENEMRKCNRNFEIEVKAGSKIKIETGISFVTEANCKVELCAGTDTEALILEKVYNENKNLVLEYVALTGTFISKSSIICCIKII